jgi:hypothetical protein
MTIGIIPAILDDDSPLPYPCPVEMLPVGHTMVGGRRCLRPMAQLAVEGMIWAGVDQIVFIINEHKLDLMRFFRDGDYFGIPISYTWRRGNSLAAELDSAYHLTHGQQVVMAFPGLITPDAIPSILRSHRGSNSDITIGAIKGSKVIRESQTTGVMAWGEKFTELLREYVSLALEKKEPLLDEAIEIASQQGLIVTRIDGIQYPVKDVESWSKAVIMRQIVAPKHVTIAA